MQPNSNERRLVWMGMGLMAGLCLAYCWPHEVAHAVAADRDDRFAMATVETGFGNPEAIFVLDFLTGRLQGAMLNQQTATFTNFWARNIAADPVGATQGNNRKAVADSTVAASTAGPKRPLRRAMRSAITPQA